MAERAASRAFLKTEMAESQEATAAAIKAEAIAERAERVASQANFDHQAIANKTKSASRRPPTRSAWPRWRRQSI